MTNDANTRQFFLDMTNEAMNDMIDEAIEISMSVPDETYPEAGFESLSISEIHEAITRHEYEVWLDQRDREAAFYF
jgi:hypothetical protein